jgi:hypothetical protein
MVMVGILVDAKRLRRTKEDFREVFELLQEDRGKKLKELKGPNILYGNGIWRDVEPELRQQIIEYFCRWIGARKHHLVLTGVCREKYRAQLFPNISDQWLVAGMHIALQLQKYNQRKKKNKGRTILIFDENKMKADHIADLLWEPPDWTDSYYHRKKGQPKLDHIIDSGFTAKSHHVGLVQVADVFAFILRRYAELFEYKETPKWDGEPNLINEYIDYLVPRMSQSSIRWPKRTSSSCAKWYNQVAPDSLKKLG